MPHGRLLFVRRPDRRGPARARRVHGHLEAGRDDRHEDRARGVRGPPRARPPRTAQRVDHPLLLVCTHGKHDPCCARYGRPLYEALRDELAPDWVWQVLAHRRRPVRRQPRLPAGGALLRASRSRDGRAGSRRAPCPADPDGELPRAVDLLVRGPGSRARGPRADGACRNRRPRPSTSRAAERVDLRHLRRRRRRHTRSRRRASVET